MAKSKFDFSGLNLSDLIGIRDHLDDVVRAKAEEERAELQARLDDLSQLDVAGRRPAAASNRKVRKARKTSGKAGAHPLAGRKAPVKYRGPDGETWSGRGLAPRWLVELERRGKKRATYLIEPAN